MLLMSKLLKNVDSLPLSVVSFQLPKSSLLTRDGSVDSVSWPRLPRLLPASSNAGGVISESEDEDTIVVADVGVKTL